MIIRIFAAVFLGIGSPLMAKEKVPKSEGIIPYNFEDEVTGASQLLPQMGIADSDWSNARPWKSPNYSNQIQALGWSEQVFEVPSNLQYRVDFWRDIYGKYSTDQGVLHDKVYVDIIYEVIDFADIMRDKKKNLWQKNKEREARVNERKKHYSKLLKKLAGLKIKGDTPPSKLSAEEVRVWKLASNIHNPKKFDILNEKKRMRFQLGQKNRFLAAIFKSGKYLEQMEIIFREAQMPVELTRLPFVESSFHVRAYSKVGAAGIWQFMPSTGKSLMTVNELVDERYDPLLASAAAAKLLRGNFKELESWPLALTAYNHGVSGLKRTSKQLKTKDLAAIITKFSSDRFGFASENFYACFLAALDVERNARQHFGDVRWDSPESLAELKLNRQTEWAEVLEFFDGERSTGQSANPHLTEKVVSLKNKIPSGTLIRIPKVREGLAKEWINGLISSVKLSAALREVPLDNKVQVQSPIFPNMTASAPESAKAQEVLGLGPAMETQRKTLELLAGEGKTSAKRKIAIYQVQPGDTLNSVATRFGVKTDSLRTFNRLKDDLIRPGQKLEIPTSF